MRANAAPEARSEDEGKRYHDAPGANGDTGDDGRRGRRAEIGHRISGLPVVNRAGEVVGIVTEGDLLRRAETGMERRRARWLELLIAPGRTRRRHPPMISVLDYSKGFGHTD
jgi:CBS domain-containing protein